MTGGRTILSLIAALAAGALCSCASEDSAGRFLVQPGKYVLYSCTELATAMQANATRQHELEGLMAKAQRGSGGQIVSDLAYRPEYVQLHGEMNELRKSAVDRDCKAGPGAVPGTGNPPGRASDQLIR